MVAVAPKVVHVEAFRALTLVVTTYHFVMYAYAMRFAPSSDAWRERVLGSLSFWSLYFGANHGVDLFFVMSGFLLGRRVAPTAARDLLRSLTSRYLRLLPLVATPLLLNVVLHPSGVAPTSVAGWAALCGNLFPVPAFDEWLGELYMLPCWSLAVDFQVGCIISVVCYAVGKRACVAACLPAALVSTAWRAAWSALHPVDPHTLHTQYLLTSASRETIARLLSADATAVHEATRAIVRDNMRIHTSPWCRMAPFLIGFAAANGRYVPCAASRIRVWCAIFVASLFMPGVHNLVRPDRITQVVWQASGGCVCCVAWCTLLRHATECPQSWPRAWWRFAHACAARADTFAWLYTLHTPILIELMPLWRAFDSPTAACVAYIALASVAANAVATAVRTDALARWWATTRAARR